MESTEALLEHLNNILLLSYVSKRNKNVLMMSSSHSSFSITETHRKPAVIMDYNKHEGGVDTLDENCEEFNCLRKTNCWPMVNNYNLINVASNNAFLIIRGNGKSNKKQFFLKTLAFSLLNHMSSKENWRGKLNYLPKSWGSSTPRCTLALRSTPTTCVSIPSVPGSSTVGWNGSSPWSLTLRFRDV